MAPIQAVPTKILFIDQNEASFQVQRCVAKALSSLPPVQLYHAHDATEALAMIDKLSPDVIIIDEEDLDENELLIDSLGPQHPPIVLQTEENITSPSQFTLNQKITRIPRSESLEGIHQTLLLAAALGVRQHCSRAAVDLH